MKKATNQFGVQLATIESAVRALRQLYNAQVEAECAAKRALRKAAPPKVARTPVGDPRVAAIRQSVRDVVGNAQVFNNLLKKGNRSVKVWKPMQPAIMHALCTAIIARVPDAKFVELNPSPYRNISGKYLRVLLPAL